MALETQMVPLPEPKFSRYRSVKRALARDTLPLPLPPSSTARPPPRLDSTSQSFSRYRGTRSDKLPPTSPSNLASESAQGHAKELAHSPNGHASRRMVSTRQTSPSERHTVSVANQGAHELPRSSDLDCFKPSTRSRPTSEPKKDDRHMHNKPLGTPSQCTGEGPQIPREWESRQQGHEDKAWGEGGQPPETESRQKAGQDFLLRNDAGKIRQKRLGERDACGALGGDTQQVKKLEIQEKEEHKRSDQKRDVIQSTSSFRKEINDYVSNLDYDRSPFPVSAITGKREKTLNRTISSPVRLEAGGGGIVSGLDAPLSAVNAGERVCFVPQKCISWR